MRRRKFYEPTGFGFEQEIQRRIKWWEEKKKEFLKRMHQEKATKNSIEMVRDDIPALEESFYWRGAAKIAIGETEDGFQDLLTCLEYQRFYPPCIKALNEQGIYP